MIDTLPYNTFAVICHNNSKKKLRSEVCITKKAHCMKQKPSSYDFDHHDLLMVNFYNGNSGRKMYNEACKISHSDRETWENRKY